MILCAQAQLFPAQEVFSTNQLLHSIHVHKIPQDFSFLFPSSSLTIILWFSPFSVALLVPLPGIRDAVFRVSCAQVPHSRLTNLLLQQLILQETIFLFHNCL